MDNLLKKMEAATNAKKEEIKEPGQQMNRPLTKLAGGYDYDQETMCPACGGTKISFKSYPAAGNNPNLREYELKCRSCGYYASWLG